MEEEDEEEEKGNPRDIQSSESKTVTKYLNALLVFFTP